MPIVLHKPLDESDDIEFGHQVLVVWPNTENMPHGWSAREGKVTDILKPIGDFVVTWRGTPSTSVVKSNGDRTWRVDQSSVPHWVWVIQREVLV